MTDRVVPPSISAVSFNCPYCGALADQTWFDVYAVRVDKHGAPFRADEKTIKLLEAEKSLPADVRQRYIDETRRTVRGEVYFSHRDTSHYKQPEVINLSLSMCYSCKQLSIWIHDKVL